jgi:predicted TIM-barrel enzyme
MNKELHIRNIDEKINNGEAIIVAGVGSGATAKAASRGGADMIATYNTAVYRIQGIPTAMAFLPYDDCNALALNVAPQVMANAGDTPVMLGIGAHDPRRNLAKLVDQAQELGMAGVTNEPFIGMYEGDLRNQMEAAGLGFGREVELIRIASERGLLTLAYVFTPEEAKMMVEAGADFIGAMVGGVTSGGSAGGAATVSLDDAIETIKSITKAAAYTGKKVPVLVHGGPLNDVKSVQTVLNATDAAGYITGSTGERLPIEKSVKETIASFKSLRKEK